MDPKHWTTLNLCLVILAIFLQVSGYVIPLWVWINLGSEHVGISLWYQIKSTNSSLVVSAVPGSPDKVFATDIGAYWNEVRFNVVRGMETAALVGVVVLLVAMIVYRVGIYHWKGMRSLNLLITFVAIITLLSIAVGVIVFCAQYWHVLGSSPRVSSTSFPWSLLFHLAATLLLLLVAVLMRTKCRPRKLGVALPVSGDAKMELHPTTKNGAVQRYFTPSPYSEDRRSAYQSSAYYTEADGKVGASMFENPGYRTDLPEPQEQEVKVNPRESPRLLSEFPRGAAATSSRYGDVERVTTTTRYVTTNVDRPLAASAPVVSAPEPDSFYLQALPATRGQSDSEHVFYTGRNNSYVVQDREWTSAKPTSRNERDVTRFSSDGRMVAQSHVYDLRPNEYSTDLAIERSVHMDRTRGTSGPKVVGAVRNDVGRGASTTGYIYRPYTEMRY